MPAQASDFFPAESLHLTLTQATWKQHCGDETILGLEPVGGCWHFTLCCRLSEAESYAVAQLPGAGIWLLRDVRTWAQSQPWEEVHAQLGCPGFATLFEKVHLHTHTACVCSLW